MTTDPTLAALLAAGEYALAADRLIEIDEPTEAAVVRLMPTLPWAADLAGCEPGDICDLAGHLDRLFPGEVDDTLAGNGNREAGYEGHDMARSNSLNGRRDNGMDIVGYSYAGGNCGHPVLYVMRADVGLAVAVAGTMTECDDLTEFAGRLRAVGVRVDGGEGCYIPDGDYAPVAGEGDDE